MTFLLKNEMMKASGASKAPLKWPRLPEPHHLIWIWLMTFSQLSFYKLYFVKFHTDYFHFFFSTSCSAASLALLARIPKRRALARAIRRLAKALKFFSSSEMTRAFSLLCTCGNNNKKKHQDTEFEQQYTSAGLILTKHVITLGHLGEMQVVFGLNVKAAISKRVQQFHHREVQRFRRFVIIWLLWFHKGAA